MATVTGAGPDVGRVPPSDAIYRALKGLLIDDSYSDLVVKCGGREFRVHRAIVCTQSTFFAKLAASASGYRHRRQCGGLRAGS